MPEEDEEDNKVCECIDYLQSTFEDSIIESNKLKSLIELLIIKGIIKEKEFNERCIVNEKATSRDLMEVFKELKNKK